jgi:hypothetical protein
MLLVKLTVTKNSQLLKKRCCFEFPNVCHIHHRFSLLDPDLKQPNPVHTYTTYFFKISRNLNVFEPAFPY